MTEMRKLVILLLPVVFLTGCFYKSVMEGTADDVLKARIYSFGEKNYFVMHEAVFQAVSKESGRGLTLVSGFNVHRISVYNTIDGSLLVRKKTGKQSKNPIEFLGCSEDNLWFYSFTNGIHSLDPETLQMKISQDSIFLINPDLKDNLATCEWYQYSQYFQFNDITRQVVLTDNKGYRYVMDTKTLIASRVLGDYKTFDARTEHHFETVTTFPKPYLVIYGDLRKNIRGENREILNPDLTYLDGKLITDCNPARIMERIENNFSLYNLEIEKLNQKISVLNSMNDGKGPAYRTEERSLLRELENEKYILQNDIGKLEKAKTDIAENGFSNQYKQLLSPDNSTFFVFHRSNTEKTAHAVISRLKLTSDGELRELWHSEITGLFFDPSAAEETDNFKEVFSSGNPQFTFSWIEITKNKLIIARMLHVFCIDINNGDLLWKFRI